jgi:hypothetical protein
MDATFIEDGQFRQFLETERSRALQRNLFTGEPEILRIDVAAALPDDDRTEC